MGGINVASAPMRNENNKNLQGHPLSIQKMGMRDLS